MKYSLFSKLYDEANEYSDLDMYISERGWQEWMDKYSDGNDFTRIIEILNKIYDLAHMGIKEIRTSINMPQNGFSIFLSIPLTSVQNWEYEKRSAPDYLVKYIAYIAFQEGLDE